MVVSSVESLSRKRGRASSERSRTMTPRVIRRCVAGVRGCDGVSRCGSRGTLPEPDDLTGGSSARVADEEEHPFGHILALAGRLAREQGSPEGFRTIINTGRIGRQDVYHLHVHIIGGPNPLPRMIAKE